MLLRLLIVATTLGSLACSTGTTGVNDQDRLESEESGDGPEPPKADRGQFTDIEWANQFFVTQIHDDRFNPDGIEVDADSNNCGPASLAMLMGQQGAGPSNLAAEMSIDHARAMMYRGYPDIDPSSLSEGATMYLSEGVVLVDDDTHPVFFDLVDDAPSIAQGIRSGGATPVFGYSWSEIDALLEATGAVIAHGHITEAWRGHFSGDYGASSPGAVSHFVAIFPASSMGQFIVCDPMHRGGSVLMSRSELGAFFRSPVNEYETTIRVVAWEEASQAADQRHEPTR